MTKLCITEDVNGNHASFGIGECLILGYDNQIAFFYVPLGSSWRTLTPSHRHTIDLHDLLETALD